MSSEAFIELFIDDVVSRFKQGKPGLYLITGCMFSGKTTLSVDIAKTIDNKRSPNQQILNIKHSIDDRDDKDVLSTHGGLAYIPTNLISTNKLDDIDFSSYYCIMVNEAQFFDSLDILRGLSRKHLVILEGLDSDFNGDLFGHMTKLIPYCDNIIKLHAVCTSCGSKAYLTARIANNSNQILVGGSESYVAVCKNCHQRNLL